MDKRKIYIAVIIICFAASAGILYWSSQDQSTGLPEGLGPINTNIDNTAANNNAPVNQRASTEGLPTPSETTEYPAPRVFPNDTKLDLSVYNSASFQNLVDYAPLTVNPEQIGRENPFQNY